MPSRRTFLKTTGALTLGTACASQAPAGSYAGPREMPTNVTLLSMRNADGSETLGVKLDGDDVLDVRMARHLLGIAAPLTLGELLREGNATGLNELTTAARRSPRARAAVLPESSITLAGCSPVRARSCASG